jgi:hypothetical protein
MKYLSDIQSTSTNPKLMEDLYQTAQREDAAGEFKADLLACYETSPENVLFATWYYRLQQILAEPQEKTRKSINWKLAVPLSFLAGVALWALSDSRFVLVPNLPYLFVYWAPIAALFALCFLAFSAKTHFRRFLWVGVALVVACVYVFLLTPGQGPQYQQRYSELMIIHLPLLSWVALGLSLLGWRSTPDTRFAFLIKSIEVMITAGLYLIAGLVFGGITVGMFSALSVTLPDVVIRLIVAGGFGLLPVMAVASVYDPQVSPLSQDFNQGLSKFISTMMRLLLPMVLVILVIYLFVIPFNFMQPFFNRDVLIVYNIMLFAIMGLLVGATPIHPEDVSIKVQNALCNGILAVAILTVLVSLYALSAVIYRTVLGGITINRLTIIGWNSINIAILILLIVRRFKAGRQAWVESLCSVFSLATNAYVAWVVFLIVAIPLLFR